MSATARCTRLGVLVLSVFLPDLLLFVDADPAYAFAGTANQLVTARTMHHPNYRGGRGERNIN